MITLTEELISKFEPDGKKWIVFFDREVPCLGVRVYPGGSKSFIFRYRMLGQKHLVVIAPCWKLTITEARAKALEMCIQIDKDIDLAKERARRKSEDRKLIPFREFCKMYIVQHAMPHKKSWREDQRRINNYLLPAWQHKFLSEITRLDISELHKQIGANYPYQANRVQEQISVMFNLARTWDFKVIDVSTKSMRPYREQARDRWVKPAEMERLAVAIEAEPDEYIRIAVKLLLLTGLRKTELLRLKWKDIDFDSKELRIDGKLTKNGKVHIEPLSDDAIELIRSAPRFADNPFLFPGREQSKGPLIKYSATKCRNTIDKVWNRIRTQARLEDVQIHDLRRTSGAWLAQSGHSLHTIGHVLNQSNERVTQVYARLDQAHVRSAIEDLSTKITPYFEPKRSVSSPFVVSIAPDVPSPVDESIRQFVQSLRR